MQDAVPSVGRVAPAEQQLPMRQTHGPRACDHGLLQSLRQLCEPGVAAQDGQGVERGVVGHGAVEGAGQGRSQVVAWGTDCGHG
ncbi:MAG: hypothetical protein ACK56F_13915, partial [bacterium]